MANRPKLLVIPTTFLDAVEKLLRTAPPPKTAQDKADRATAKRILKRRRPAVEVLDENDLARMVAKKRAAMKKKAGARKKAR